MKSFRNYKVLFLTLLIVITSSISCITQRQVKEIVENTNAQTVNTYLDRPGHDANNQEWKDSIAEIDKIISANPDQKTLINHLRVRQAMLLTVYSQGNLANEIWNLVENDKLTNERDKALYSNRKALIWWYEHASQSTPFDIFQQDKAKEFRNEMLQNLNGVENKGLRIYLSTIIAQIALRVANDSDVSTPEKIAQIRNDMVNNLENYVKEFNTSSQNWVKENPDQQIDDLISITEFRNRIWLKEMIKEYKLTAQNLELQTPDWRPEWITNLDFN